MAAVCPITTRPPTYPGEVPIAAGQAGQTLGGLVLVHQVRTIDLHRITAFQIGGVAQVMSDPGLRRAFAGRSPTTSGSMPRRPRTARREIGEERDVADLRARRPR
jgi:hypothetical protein